VVHIPRGLSKIKASAQENAARRAAYEAGGPGHRKLILVDDGESAKVRFLEQGEEVWSVYCHKLPPPPGRNWGDTIQCLDQDNEGKPCPACMRQIGRFERVVINVIWFNAPKFKREPAEQGKLGKLVKDNDGNPIMIGTEDVIATWETSVKNGGRLEMLDTKHGGLTHGIYSVTRQGAKGSKETEYHIDFEEIKEPTAAEVELVKSKPDPREIIKKLTPGDMERIYSGGQVSSANGESSSTEGNAFAEAAKSNINKGAFGI
jgi:hypothetical protein